MFLFVFSILSRRCLLLATFLSVLFCLFSLLTSDSRFDLVWFRLSCDHGWIRSGSVNVRKTTNNNNNMFDGKGELAANLITHHTTARTKRPMELVHIDTAGPFPASLGGLR